MEMEREADRPAHREALPARPCSPRHAEDAKLNAEMTPELPCPESFVSPAECNEPLLSLHTYYILVFFLRVVVVDIMYSTARAFSVELQCAWG